MSDRDAAEIEALARELFVHGNYVDRDTVFCDAENFIAYRDQWRRNRRKAAVADPMWQWCAMFDTGHWFAFESRPACGSLGWHRGGHELHLEYPDDRPAPMAKENWRKSLHRRDGDRWVLVEDQ